MQHNAKTSDPSIIETNQKTDNFLHLPVDDVLVRLLSVRCHEAQVDDLPCQDYARVVSHQQGKSLSFCVCDGVGASYKSDFSANYLAISLVNWLQELPDIEQDSSTLSSTLQTLLDSWADSAQRTLQDIEIPPDTPALIREVLEEHRNMHGSETVFFSGRVDYEPYTSALTSCQSPSRALFCWMGNVSAHVFLASDEYITLGNEGNDRNRWSTLRGCRGDLSLQTLIPGNLERLIIHTDGLDTIGAALAHLDDDELQDRTQQLLLLPTNDDMTMLDLRWPHAIHEEHIPVEEEQTP